MFDRNGESDVQPFNQRTAIETAGGVSERKNTKTLLSILYVARKPESQLTKAKLNLDIFWLKGERCVQLASPRAEIQTATVCERKANRRV